MRTARLIRFSLAAAALSQALTAGPISFFVQHNLVSSIPGLAANTDPALINPWGMSAGAASPFWVSDQGTGVSTLYSGTGAKQALTVTIPAPGGVGPSLPTGQVANPNAAGGAFNGDAFIFATIRGTIDGWRNPLGTTAEILVDNSTSGAVYTGLGVGAIGANTYLYAADFAHNQVTVFGSTGAPALTGSFTDPNLPAGYAPFNVQTLGTQVFVTYAVVGPTGEDQAGPGNGIVDVYDLNGVLQGRVVSNGALNSPWGLALAPVGFGPLGGDLLVGNFGDGTVNAYSLSGNNVGTLVGTLANTSGAPLTNDGLWALKFGNNGAGFRPGTLYLTAGLNDENDGLFAAIDAVPEPAPLAMVTAGLVVVLMAWRRRAGARPR